MNRIQINGKWYVEEQPQEDLEFGASYELEILGVNNLKFSVRIDDDGSYTSPYISYKNKIWDSDVFLDRLADGDYTVFEEASDVTQEEQKYIVALLQEAKKRNLL